VIDQPTQTRRPLPPITPVRPRFGWATATRPRQLAALATAPLLVITVGLSVVDDLAVQLLLVVTQLSLGSICCYHLARVLRPPAAPSAERSIRHAVAAVATSSASWWFGAVALGRTFSWSGSGGVIPLLWLGGVAYALVPLTLAWGLVAALIRSSRMG